MVRIQIIALKKDEFSCVLQQEDLAPVQNKKENKKKGSYRR